EPNRMACIVGASAIAATDETSAVAGRSIDDAAAAVGWRESVDRPALPSIARRLREQQHYGAVCIRSIDGDARALSWLDSAHASGWIEPAGPIDEMALAIAIDDALGRGFVGADA